MSDYERNVATAPFGQALGRAGTVAVDEGLRAYMLRIYNFMVLGLAITGLAALGTYMLSVTTDPSLAALKLRDGLMLTAFGKALFVSPLKWVVIFAPLGLVFLLSFGIERMRPAMAQIVFWIYAALVGISLGSIFMVFTHTSIVRVFFITAASFGALSLWGYTTQRDLTGMGSFLLMGLFGIILASLVNLFMASSALQFAISVIGVRGVRGPHRLGHPAAEDRISLRRDGRRGGGAFRDHRRAVALPQLHQPVHAAAATARPARGIAGHRLTPIKAPAPAGAFFCVVRG